MKNPSLCKYLISACVSLQAVTVLAQTRSFNIDIRSVNKIIVRPLSKLGGTNPSGESIAVNNYYISKGNIPFIPITGEFHFTRYPNTYWDESIRKIKAGGINTIATYVFWNIHEQKEGFFNWSGDRDLRKFIELCAKNHINVIVRIGPFDHGEIRNGGLPDWLLGKPLSIRSNDPLYLHYVEELYQQIGKQLEGLYYKDGGPVIGIQLENEYQHSASPWGLTYPGQPYDMTVADRDRSSAHEGVAVASANNPYAAAGNDHMRILKSLARKYGIDAPLYTATGWGYAAIIPDETLPVTAAYAYPTWVAKRETSPFYLYKDLHASPDYAPVRYKASDYPAFAAELGPGIMSTYTRRPLVPAESVDALINRCLGGGANGIGYYMYHGGSTPVAEHYFFNDEAYGYPKISYDFQAPVGEYGQVRPSFQRLKLVHFFINDFAPELAPMVTVLSESNSRIKPDDVDALRYAVRANGESGFLFVNNFQDNAINHDQTDVSISVKTETGEINIPAAGGFTVKAGENVIMPFNLNINGVNLVYSTAQLLTKGGDPQNPYYVFFSADGISPQFCFAKSNRTIQDLVNGKVVQKGGNIIVESPVGQTAGFTLHNEKGIKTKILIISKEMALKCYLQEWKDGRHLIFTDATVLTGDKSVEMLSEGQHHFRFSVYPKISNTPSIDRGTIKSVAGAKLLSNYAIDVPVVDLQPQVFKSGTRKMMVTIPKTLPEGVNDVFMKVDYIGDTGMGFLNGELVADEFYKGVPWEIGLKRFIARSQSNEFSFYFRPIIKGAPYLVDLPIFLNDLVNKEEQTLQVKGVSYTIEYKIKCKF